MHGMHGALLLSKSGTHLNHPENNLAKYYITKQSFALRCIAHDVYFALGLLAE